MLVTSIFTCSALAIVLSDQASRQTVSADDITPDSTATHLSPVPMMSSLTSTLTITDKIIAEIRRSRFLVADFTHGCDGARGSVYYEAGFAHGLNIPVIFTAREGTKPHFDTSTYPHIFWNRDNLPAFRTALTNRILALKELGPGPRLP